MLVPCFFFGFFFWNSKPIKHLTFYLLLRISRQLLTISLNYRHILIIIIIIIKIII